MNQWTNSQSVINWLKKLTNKEQRKFVIFDIQEFYPSISADLLNKAIDYASKLTTITPEERTIISHARRSTLHHNNCTWVKKNNDSEFDVTMGSWDGAETCEIVGLYLLNELKEIININDIGLYRDDGLAAIPNQSGPQMDNLRKKITQIFKNNGLSIEVKTGLVAVDYLDLTLDLQYNTYRPYKKTNNQPKYVHSKSNHPPTILKEIPQSISKRISNNSSSEEIFMQSAQYYNQILRESGYEESLKYTPKPSTPSKRNRKREIIWFNPPYSMNVDTNVGKIFLNLIDKHFKNSKLAKIFNRNTVKISYSCMPNIKQIIKGQNAKLTGTKDNEANQPPTCNCRGTCPIDKKCLTPNIIYMAEVTELSTNSHSNINTDQCNNNENNVSTRNSKNNSNNNSNNNTNNKNNNNIARDNYGTPNTSNNDCNNRDSNNNNNNNNNSTNVNINNKNNNDNNTPPDDGKTKYYIGATESFKPRYRNHIKSFTNQTYMNETALSKHIWQLKESGKTFDIKWKILKKTSGYKKSTNNCSLCLSEKLAICRFKNKSKLLNKRSELISKCRHANKHLLKYFV